MVPVESQITVACLPVAGSDNPYQRLMIEGLNQGGQLRAFTGIHDKFFGIARTVLRYRPEYLHFDWIASYYYRRYRWLTWLSAGTFCAQILLARLLGVRLVWTLHNIVPHDASQLAMHRFCRRFLARRCDWIRVFAQDTVSRAAAELRVPSTKFEVVPEGDYTLVYPNQLSRDKARQQLNLPATARILLSLGLIKPYKGILELVDAFKGVDTPDAYLLIAGRIMDEAYGGHLKQNLSDGVILIDEFIPDQDLQVYFNAADAVVLPFTKIENSGSVIMAMGFGKPILAPATGAIHERLHRQPEWLYQSDEEFKQKLRELTIAPSDVLREAGNRNFEALANYTWEDFAVLFI